MRMNEMDDVLYPNIVDISFLYIFWRWSIQINYFFNIILLFEYVSVNLAWYVIAFKKKEIDRIKFINFSMLNLTQTHRRRDTDNNYMYTDEINTHDDARGLTNRIWRVWINYRNPKLYSR